MKLEPYTKKNGEKAFWNFSFGAGAEMLAVVEGVLRVSKRLFRSESDQSDLRKFLRSPFMKKYLKEMADYN